METADIAKEIKLARVSLGFNQAELAKKLWPDKDPKTAQCRISRYETGQAVVPAVIYLQIIKMVTE